MSKESRENFSAFYCIYNSETICSNVEYDQPNQAFYGKES